MISEENKRRVLEYMDEMYPNAGCELIYNKNYEFLICVMLSAQTTDSKVNSVTKVLFSKYPSLVDLKNASLVDIETILKPLGLYHNKAVNLIGTARAIVDKYGGIVPSEKEKLILLPGVGNKTANVYRAEILKAPEFAVDTHVERLTKRLGFVDVKDNVGTIELKMKKILDENQYIKVHHQLIHFGRYFCKAIKPTCELCKIKDICHKFK